MSWEVISALGTITGTILTFISIMVVVGIEQQKNVADLKKPRTKKFSQDVSLQRQNRISQSVIKPTYTESLIFDDDFDDETEFEKPHDPYAPYLYISIGLIGACGGIASILVPWLLLIRLPELQCILYPLLITGIIGGVTFSLFMDKQFEMDKATPELRFPLSAICGVIGGWLGLLVIIGVILYTIVTSSSSSIRTSSTNKEIDFSQKKNKPHSHEFERKPYLTPYTRIGPSYDNKSRNRRNYDR